MTFAEAEKILVSRQDFIKKDGLERVYACLEKLGDPHGRLKCVHVTGTNGKGSVCALFEAVGRAAGLKTGLFISPHLVSMTERIQISGRNIGEDVFAALFEEVFRAGPDLSFFELLTCMAFLHFDREKTDLAVIEVGIGGRLDTTNVLPSTLLSVIASVDFDHQKFLGDTLAGIASQKAGIIKKGGVCLAPLLPPEARSEILKEAQAKGAQAHFLAPLYAIKSRDWERGSMVLRHKKTGEETVLGIIGDAQVQNATLVGEGAAFLRGAGLKIEPRHVEEGFQSVRWPARFQPVRAGRGYGEALFVVDGAHNPEAARCFAATWKSSPFASKKAAFVIGMLNDKERAGIFSAISGLEGSFIFTRPDSARAADPCVLADEFMKFRPDAEVEVQEDIGAALASASGAGVAAVLGSFYLAGAALQLISRRE